MVNPTDILNYTSKQIGTAQNSALMRLQLIMTATVHQIFGEFSAKAQKIVIDQAGPNGLLDSNEVLPASRIIKEEWKAAFAKYEQALANGLQNAVAIPFAAVARNHFRFIGPEPYQRGDVKEAFPAGIGQIPFTPELNQFINQTRERVYPDGLNLSARIWKLDNQSWAGIEKVLFNSVGKGAWETARELEQFLGANQNCRRWTRERLDRTSKAAIAAGSQAGLLRKEDGQPCSAKGVSYNALRLARNEIQTIHHAMNDYLLEQQPYITKERIYLSAQHPPIGCECETVVTGGEGGKGIYQLGTIKLPIHVLCLCYKVGQYEDEDSFLAQLAQWVGVDPKKREPLLPPAGELPFSMAFGEPLMGLAMTGAYPRIDNYMAFLGIQPPTVDKGESWGKAWRNLLAISAVFLFWLLADPDEMLDTLNR
jgi:hypothetical protein